MFKGHNVRIVLKLGGHVLWSEQGIRADVVEGYCTVVRELVNEGHRVALVVGGGSIARMFVKYGRELGLSEGQCDVLGIECARLNALLVAQLMSDISYPEVPRSLDETLKALATSRVVVIGGLQPGQSTTAVACVIADTWPCDVLIIATDVDGIYTDDPKKNPRANKLRSVRASELLKMFLHQVKYCAGTYTLFDYVSLSILARARFRAYVINGLDPRNVVRVLRGEDIGTEILCGE
ncbi:MAG: UMP kinase [Thermoprotei archaeon]|nr:MAG: UMP kinase [Thermoprotei archaeon]